MDKKAAALVAAVAAAVIAGVVLVSYATHSADLDEDPVGGWRSGSVPGTLSPQQRARLESGASLEDLGVTAPPSPPALTLEQRRALEGQPPTPPVTFLVALEEGLLAAEPGMTYCPCRS